MNRRRSVTRGSAAPVARQRTVLPRLRAWRDQHLHGLFSSLGRLAARPGSTAMTVAVLGFALALPMLFWLALSNARGLGEQLQGAGAISVFLKPGLAPDAVQAQVARWQGADGVQALTLRTPEQGLAEFRTRSGFAEALKVLTDNPLPAVLLVQARPDAVAGLVARLRADADVDQVQYDAQWRQRLSAILGVARRVTAVLGVLLALAALLVVGNTVRMDIAARAEEIAVMQLLGAEAGFVRRPFLYAGLWYGTFAAGVGLMLIAVTQWFLAAPLGRLADAYGETFSVHGMQPAQCAGILLAGAVLGWLGAFAAASRHIALGQPR